MAMIKKDHSGLFIAVGSPISDKPMDLYTIYRDMQLVHFQRTPPLPKPFEDFALL
jgi:hypothetical protein